MQVSLSPAAQKTADILSSLRSTFAEKGFDGASMQDLARAAGMSASNFYRYFPSKAAIIEAMIMADLDRMGQDLELALLTNDPLAEMRSQIRARIKHHQCCQDGTLWAEIHAVSLRRPEIAQIMSRMENQVTALLVKVFSARTGLSSDAAEQVFASKASLIIALFRSAAMIGSPDSAVKAQLTEQIITVIERTLDDIASAARKA